MSYEFTCIWTIESSQFHSIEPGKWLYSPKFSTISAQDMYTWRVGIKNSYCPTTRAYVNKASLIAIDRFKKFDPLVVVCKVEWFVESNLSTKRSNAPDTFLLQLGQLKNSRDHYIPIDSCALNPEKTSIRVQDDIVVFGLSLAIFDSITSTVPYSFPVDDQLLSDELFEHSLKVDTHDMQYFCLGDYKKQGTLRLRIPKFSEFESKIKSAEVMIRGLPWYILVGLNGKPPSLKANATHLSLSLHCNFETSDYKNSCCTAKYSIRINNNSEDFKGLVSEDVYSHNLGWGYPELIKLSDLKNASKGYIKNDTLVVEVSCEAEIPKQLGPDGFILPEAKQEDPTADEIILVSNNDQYFKCNRSSLEEMSTFSKECLKLLDSSMDETATDIKGRVFKINTSGDSVKEMLRYLLTGHVDQSKFLESAPEIATVAEKLGFVQLKNHCYEFISKSLNAGNASKVLIAAQKQKSDELTSLISKLILAMQKTPITEI